MIWWRYDAQCYLDQDLDENGNVWGKGWMQPEPGEVDQKKGYDDSTKEGQPDWLLSDSRLTKQY